MLNWDETEVLAVLEVVPDVEEYETCHVFTVQKSGLKLVVTIYQYDGNIFFELYNIDSDVPIFNMELKDCDGVIRKYSEKGEWLEFAPSKCFGNYSDKITSVPYGVKVSVKPSINITLY